MSVDAVEHIPNAPHICPVAAHGNVVTPESVMIFKLFKFTASKT
jgi:hypothetical protein